MRVPASRTLGLLVSVLTLLLAPAILSAKEKDPPTPQPIVDPNSTLVAPVLSPPLRDVAPLQSPGADNHVVENIELVHPSVNINGPAQPDTVRQSSFGVTAPTPTGTNFDGTRANGFAPPDSDGRVGPNHYIQFINVQFAIFDKAGTKLYGPANGNTLFLALGASSPCSTTNNGDPIVVYDALADRWILTQFIVGASPNFSHQCVAITTTGDPLGTYYLYDFITAAAQFVDYPHWGVWPDSYYMTAHLFNTAGTAYLGQGLFAYERPKMLAGLPARLQGVNLDPTGTFGGALPTDLDGLTPPPAGSSNYVIAPGSPELDGTASDVLHVWKALATWGPTPTFTITGPTDVATAAFNPDLCGEIFTGARNCIPEPAPAVAADYVDAISDRLMYRIAYRNIGGTESLVLNHTVNVAAASGHATNQAGVRWYEVRTPGTTPTIFQQGTYAPDASNRWMGSIAMDNSGNMALGYSRSSTSILPEIDLTGRLVGDAPGTMGAEILMKAGLGVQTDTANRWGDYSYMSVDPRDGCTFWYTNQYQPANGTFNWASRIASFRFPTCVSPARGTIQGFVTDSVTGLPIVGALVSTNNGFSGATDSNGHYQIVLPPGSYTVSASADQRDCTPSASQSATVVDGGTLTLNFSLTGIPLLSLGTVGIDDSIGNNNGVINRNECVRLNLPLKNIGCATATGISAVLSTSTPGVTVTQGNSGYPNLPAGGTSLSDTRFQIATSPSFVCGTAISFTLTVQSSAGSTPFSFSLPTCQSAPVVVSGSITGTDLQENGPGRMGRNGIASSCAGKTCPGPLGAGTRAYDAYNFTNSGPVASCITVTLTPACAPASNGDIFSVAYLGSFNPTSLCVNYLGDVGGSPFNGNSVPYSFTVPAGGNFVVIANESTMGAGCTSYTLSVTGLTDNSDAGGCNPTSDASSFFTVPPCRLIDTRTTDVPALGAGGQRTFILGGSCGIPSTALAVSLNIAATNETAGGNLQLFAGGSPAPPTSVLNYNAGQTRANNAIVTLGAGGTITIKCNQASGTADVVLDVNGYFQ